MLYYLDRTQITKIHRTKIRKVQYVTESKLRHRKYLLTNNTLLPRSTRTIPVTFTPQHTLRALLFYCYNDLKTDAMYYWSDIDIVLTDWGPEIDSIQNGERTQQTRRSASSGNLWPTEGMLSSLILTLIYSCSRYCVLLQPMIYRVNVRA